MGNPATKAPNFTPENAADMARRSTASRLARIEREKNEKEQAERNSRAKPDDARKEQTLKQIDRLDKLINSALDDADEERFLKLTAAKERLWKLVQPTAGVLRSKARDRNPTAQPLPETPQEPPK